MEGLRYAYRVLWEQQRGPLGSLKLHHKCHNSWCVNLNHLEPITQAEHIKEHGLPGDWGQADKTQCPVGHDYNEANTYTYKRKNGSVERHCKLCHRETKKRYRERQRQK